MYSRRTRTPFRWLFGAAIVAITVAVFLIFQATQTETPLLPTPSSAAPSEVAAQATSQPTQAPTPQAPTIWRILSDKAKLITDIVEVPFAQDDNWDLTNLHTFAGHLEGTLPIGKGGNYVLAGHVEMKDGSAGPFANIHLLGAGDLVLIVGNTADKSVILRYKVTEVKTVDPNSLNEIRNHGYEELTLVTCVDYDAKTGVYNKRVVVHARAM